MTFKNPFTIDTLWEILWGAGGCLKKGEGFYIYAITVIIVITIYSMPFRRYLVTLIYDFWIILWIQFIFSLLISSIGLILLYFYSLCPKMIYTTRFHQITFIILNNLKNPKQNPAQPICHDFTNRDWEWLTDCDITMRFIWTIWFPTFVPTSFANRTKNETKNIPTPRSDPANVCAMRSSKLGVFL